MSAADLHAQALARIAEQRALIAAGTPGPWEWGVSADREWALIGSPEYSSQQLRSADDDDAALVVAAVNDYGPLLDLAEAVLRRHHVSPGTDHCDLCWDGPKRGIQTRESWWPCPDATAALRSIGLVTT